MKKRFILLLLHASIVFFLIFIYCLLIKNNLVFEWIIYSLTIVGLILCIIFRKDLKKAAKETSSDRYISLISLEIALIVFVQTSIQFEKNNEQFKKNRIASDSLFRTQLKHAEILNQLQIKNSMDLNDSLTNELKKIQDINKIQSLSAENQLKATQKQLELSEQSLNDFIYDTRAELAFGKTNIVNIDTLNSNEVELSISTKVQNTGKRTATEVEFRQIIILCNGKNMGVQLINDLEFVTANTSKNIFFKTTIPQKECEDFYHWFQIRYFDERLEKYTDRSYYYHYFKNTLGFDFYYAKDEQKSILRKIVDEELSKEGLSLTIN